MLSNRMFGLRFFLQVKYETWVGFRLQKLNTNEDSFVPFKPKNLVSFSRNTIRKEELCDRYCVTVKISQHNMANA